MSISSIALTRRALLTALPLSMTTVTGCAPADVQIFPSIASALGAVQSLDTGHRSIGAWSLPQVLEHSAQSIEYSMSGYPQMRSSLFRSTLGNAAFALFDARGAMTHSLSEPIPGAPALAAPLPAAISRLVNALQAFEAYDRPLHPHFAYGALDKAQYTRAHLMHLADHWFEIVKS
jgi:hypothetical protein